jgi:hypothetical protein
MIAIIVNYALAEMVDRESGLVCHCRHDASSTVANLPHANIDAPLN